MATFLSLLAQNGPNLIALALFALYMQHRIHQQDANMHRTLSGVEARLSERINELETDLRKDISKVAGQVAAAEISLQKDVSGVAERVARVEGLLAPRPERRKQRQGA